MSTTLIEDQIRMYAKLLKIPTFTVSCSEGSIANTGSEEYYDSEASDQIFRIQ